MHKLPMLFILAVFGCASQDPKPKASWKTYDLFFKKDLISFKKAKHSKLAFKIEAINPISGDICEVEGEALPIIVDSKYSWDDSETTCSIRIHFQPESVELSYTEDCQNVCGMRTTLPEIFYDRPGTCEPEELETRRNRITKLIYKKNFAAATDSFSKLLSVCEPFMDMTDYYALTNEKAYTQWRSNDSSGCRETLKPIKHWAGREDEKGQSELEHIKGLRQSINYTWKLCNIEKCPPNSLFCVD